jgi:nitrite reductase/ring-hydroxylating ferredoxin subunit
MCESDGFVAVLEEKDLQEGEMKEISVQDGQREISIIISRANGEVYAGGATCPNCGRYDCKIKDGKIWVRLS